MLNLQSQWEGIQVTNKFTKQSRAFALSLPAAPLLRATALACGLGLLAGCASETVRPAAEEAPAETGPAPLPKDFFDQNHRGDLERGIRAYQAWDFIRALHEFYGLSQEGVADAQYYLGIMFAKGQGVPRDPVQADTWLARAADGGSREAQFAYASMLWQGDYLERDRRKALRWYTAAAENEHAEAQYILGRLYAEGDAELEKGRPIGQDLSAARQWFTRAAENGFIAAQHNLALMYQYGLGVEADPDQARSWFERATQGPAPDPDIAYDFGRFHLVRTSRHYDPERALYWIQQAALAGHPEANRQVGALRKQVEISRNSLSLFGAPLALHSRTELRRAIRDQGGIALMEQDNGWFDSYDSRDVWDLSDRLFVGYSLETGRVAALQYRLPGADTPRGVAQVRALLEQRYGEPSYQGERVYQDGIYNEWKVRDTRLVLSRGANGALFLSYYVATAYEQLVREQMRREQPKATVGKALVEVY